MKPSLLLLATLFLLATACRKHNDSTTITPPKDPDVYVAGYEDISSDHSVAKLWKNGTAQLLPSSEKYAFASSVYISGNDVYVAGSESRGSNSSVVKVWKNGVPQSLTDGSKDAFANSVYVSGSDVYVAGSESNGTNQVAKIWKNGVPQSLTDG
ncbi:MAG: hypothetical protein JST09_07860, partial [Bacteroidetes bacterium]|nr:hypothetical protein [Bacteroidota bacterium]